MTAPADAGRRVEILLPDEDRVIEVEAAEVDVSIADALVDAFLLDDPDEVERRVESEVGSRGRVVRR